MVSCQLFEGITTAECERMFVCFGAREKSYVQGEVICEFVGGSKVVGVLLSGSADLIRLDVDGDRVILETMEEGGVFGEVYLVAPRNGREKGEAVDPVAVHLDLAEGRGEGISLRSDEAVLDPGTVAGGEDDHARELRATDAPHGLPGDRT